MCPLDQRCAPRHGGRGGKINGPGVQHLPQNPICNFFLNTLSIKYLNLPMLILSQRDNVSTVDHNSYSFLSHGSLFAIRNRAVQENFKRKVFVCIHGNQIIILQRPFSIDKSICHQHNKLTIAGLKRSPFYKDSFLCFCLDDTLKKNYLLLDISRPNHSSLPVHNFGSFFYIFDNKMS